MFCILSVNSPDEHQILDRVKREMGGLIRLKGLKHYQPRSEVFAGTVKVPEHVQFLHENV